jgi:hypothetical protein
MTPRKEADMRTRTEAPVDGTPLPDAHPRVDDRRGLGDRAVGRGEERGAGRRTAMLADGTELWLVPGLSLDLFAQGRRIKVVYEERDGKKWVRSVEATQ